MNLEVISRLIFSLNASFEFKDFWILNSVGTYNFLFIVS